MADMTARVTVTFDVPFMDGSSENCRKLRALLVKALEDMRVNNGHLLTEEEYALAKLVVEGAYVNGENAAEMRELAADAGVL